MKPLTREWVKKAEGDFATATREVNASRRPNYDAACFHAQQCIEKYLKARLQEADIPFQRTHNLMALLDLALPLEPSWEELRPSLQTLNAFSVEVRYPGGFADKRQAVRALSLCRELRAKMRRGLGLRP
jgi:HEPN domain-containing protein